MPEKKLFPVKSPSTAAIPDQTYMAEVSIEKVKAYLDDCFKDKKNAKFYYKNQSYAREVDIQILTGIYLTGMTSVGQRTFRIDRITNL